MAKSYRFRARNWQSKQVTGQIEAESEDVAIRELTYQGLFVVELKEIRHPEEWLGRLPLKLVRTGEIVLFTRQFATMIKSGLPLLHCLQVLQLQARNRHLRQATTGIMRSVRRGLPLWEALAEYPSIFSDLYVQMVKAGETGGRLDEVLERLAAHLEKEHEVKQRIKNALIYPCTVAILTLAVVAFLTSFVVPAFASVFNGAGVSLPTATRLLLGFTRLIRNHFWGLAASFLSVAVVLKTWSGTPRGRQVWDHFCLRLPIVGRLSTRIASARFTRILGLLAGSGVPVVVALPIAGQAAGNRVIASRMETVVRSIEHGSSMSQSLGLAGVFEPMVIQMVNVGEETGTLDQMLVKVAEYYEGETGRAVDALIALFEPALILFMAGVVGMVVIGTLLPVFEMITVEVRNGRPGFTMF